MSNYSMDYPNKVYIVIHSIPSQNMCDEEHLYIISCFTDKNLANEACLKLNELRAFYSTDVYYVSEFELL